MESTLIETLQAQLAHPLDDVLEHHIGGVLVQHQGKLAGIFTTFDVCRLLGEALQDPGRGAPGDDAA